VTSRVAAPIHQVVIGATPGDAITSMALRLRAELRRDRPSEIYALHRDPSLVDDVRAVGDLAPAGRGEVLVYHSSYGDPEVTQALLDRRERIVLAYHNITPSSFYLRHQPQVAAALEWGRHELSLLRERVCMAVADSSFNAADLVALGYRDVEVIPVGLHPSHLTTIAPSPSMASRVRRWAGSDGTVLAVAQVMPHKRIDVLVHAVHLVQTVHGLDVGLLIVGSHRLPSYASAVVELARRLPADRVWMAGSVADRDLAAIYRCSTAMVSASLHEGLAVPPLEAMAVGVPVISRDVGAVAETTRSAALLLPADAGPMLFAEAIARIHVDDGVRRELIRRGSDRVKAIEASRPTERFAAAVRKLAA